MEIQKSNQACEREGLIHIYCGDGKGKSTAAAGMALRAAGRGHRVLMQRFLKQEDSGEVKPLRSISNITVLPCAKSFGFVFQMDDVQKQKAAQYYQECLEHVFACIAQADEMFQKNSCCEPYRMLILDEAMAACRYGMIEEKQLVQWLESRRPAYLEVILTGRDPSLRMMEMADYVSEIRSIRHPFEKGVGAREGIEY